MVYRQNETYNVMSERVGIMMPVPYVYRLSLRFAPRNTHTDLPSLEILLTEHDLLKKKVLSLTPTVSKQLREAGDSASLSWLATALTSLKK